MSPESGNEMARKRRGQREEETGMRHGDRKGINIPPPLSHQRPARPGLPSG